MEDFLGDGTSVMYCVVAVGEAGKVDLNLTKLKAVSVLKTEVNEGQKEIKKQSGHEGGVEKHRGG